MALVAKLGNSHENNIDFVTPVMCVVWKIASLSVLNAGETVSQIIHLRIIAFQWLKSNHGFMLSINRASICNHLPYVLSRRTA
ncbi:MAG: hypothetical protein A2342_05550 [Gallionellales bacterium RIFOXYB12_FULL_54_9]|nr:MAG: hypothetical protein A2342_05550 [Gallionellales bacterium RIFOXYB12_FULL_54_9]